MTRLPHSRRDYLLALGATGAVAGSGAIVLSSASSDDDDDETDADEPLTEADDNDDNADQKNKTDDHADHEETDGDDADAMDELELEAIGYRTTEAETGSTLDAAFRVHNHGKPDVTVEWSVTDGKRSGSVSVAAKDATSFWVRGLEDAKAAVTLSHDGTEIATKKVDSKTELDRKTKPKGERIEFIDCQTVRVVGDFEEVVIEASFDGDDFGNVRGPVGPVDGERTIHVSELESAPENSRLDAAEAFRDASNTIPGGGAIRVANPELVECGKELFDEPEDEEFIEFIDCQTVRIVGNFAEVRFEVVFNGEGIGNVMPFIGPVEGERTVSIDELEDAPTGSIILEAEAYREGTPTIAGFGELRETNPDSKQCQEEFFGEVIA
ncbi:hypothetical protein [Natrinema pallidum]|uniref:Uncharacterized protein n=1 Tax=Natrinema pallidum DSM 3751 TaxID=1227495 RepID=L9YT62_9EURY|nr:hypothetical protein [Natrinema pallidum]ELY76871.1 hypothetical protein C487_10242 [Natrinema pallidum DSM 3751]